MKKYLLAVLLAGSTLASATTITINSDTPTGLDFSVDWGPSVGEFSAHATGPSTTLNWMGGISRNPWFYFLEIKNSYLAPMIGMGIRFWNDPDYFGPVATAFGSPNILLSGLILPTMLPLDGNIYGARFVYGSPLNPNSTVAGAVPDVGSGAVLLVIGLAGIAFAGRIERKKS